MTTSSLSPTAGARRRAARSTVLFWTGSTQRSIAESIPHIVWTASPDGATTYFNRQGTDYTGCPRETNYEWNWVTLVHPEDAERAAQAWRAGDHDAAPTSALEYRIRRFDGVFRWHACRAIPLRDAAGDDRSVDWHRDRHRGPEAAGARFAPRGAGGHGGGHPACRVSRRRPRSVSSWSIAICGSFGSTRCWPTSRAAPSRSASACTVAELVPDMWPQLEDVYRRVLAGETVNNVDVSRPSCRRPAPDAPLARQLLPGTHRRRDHRRRQRRGRHHRTEGSRRVPRRGHGQHGGGPLRPGRRRARDLHEPGRGVDARVDRRRAARQTDACHRPLPAGRRQEDPGRGVLTSSGPHPRPEHSDSRRRLHPQGWLDLPRCLLRRTAAKRSQPCKVSSSSSATSPRRRRNRRAAQRELDALTLARTHPRRDRREPARPVLPAHRAPRRRPAQRGAAAAHDRTRQRSHPARQLPAGRGEVRADR